MPEHVERRFLDWLTSTEQSAFRRFWGVLRDVRERVEGEVRRRAEAIPIFAAAMAQLSPDEQEAQRRASRTLEREALLEGRWEPYLDHLRRQGESFARMGVDFPDWYALVQPYRSVVCAELLRDIDPEKLEAIEAMDRFLDIAMATMGSVYIETKESLVQHAESRLRLYIDLFDNASVGLAIFHWDEAGDPDSFRMVAANPAAAALGGFRLHDRIGRTLRDLDPQVFDTDVPGHYAATLEAGEAREWTFAREVGGSEQVYRHRCFPLRDRYVGVLLEDVTEERRMQWELERHVEELERSNRELDDFAYVASHDLKAPLRDIDNLAEFVQEDLGSEIPKTTDRHLRLLRKRVQRMEGLLDDLLQYSRAGRVFGEPEKQRFLHVIYDVMKSAVPPWGFEVQVHGPDVEMRGPRAPFEQVLHNLVVNAIKHHDREEGRIDIAVVDRDDHLECTVADDGPGIPPRFHERVFRLFQTLKPRDQVEGSGLGLAIVKKLTEVHGGSIELLPTEGRGTSFRFTWPKDFSRPRRSKT